jgi:hypothetical protein
VGGEDDAAYDAAFDEGADEAAQDEAPAKPPKPLSGNAAKKAARAAATAASTSAAVAHAMLETTVPVAGLITSRRSPSEASRHSPLMNNLPGRILGAVAMAEISLDVPH